MRRIAARTGVGLLILASAAGLAALPYRDGAAFIARATGRGGLARSFADREAQPVSRVAIAPVPWRGGTLRAYAYQPLHATARGILLVPGVHASGIDEPRLVGFARDLAAEGHPVLTVELPDLKAYAITARTTDMIEDAAAWTMRRAEYRGEDGRVGLMGISFGGGLAVVAAGRASIRNGLAFVLSLGGHADLPRTLRYLCTGREPDGTYRQPHDYGLAIVLFDAAQFVVPPPQVAPLRAAILAFLDGSRLDLVDKSRAAAAFAEARALQANLQEPSRTYMQYVNTRDVEHLGPVLLPHLGTLGGAPALSPDRSPPPFCDVYLLHGTDDNVVPAMESTLLASWLRGRGQHVHVLLTPLITHAEVDRRSTVKAALQLIDFWSSVLNE